MHSCLFSFSKKLFSIKSSLLHARNNKQKFLERVLARGAAPIIDNWGNIVDPYVIYDEFYETVEIASLRYDEDAITHIPTIPEPCVNYSTMFYVQCNVVTPEMQVIVNMNCVTNAGARRLHTKHRNGPLTSLVTPNKKLLGERLFKVVQPTWQPLGCHRGGGSRPFSRTLSRGAIVRKKASRESLFWNFKSLVGGLRLPCSRYVIHPLNTSNTKARDFMFEFGRRYSTGIFPNWKIISLIPNRSLLLIMPVHFKY